MDSATIEDFSVDLAKNVFQVHGTDMNLGSQDLFYV